MPDVVELTYMNFTEKDRSKKHLIHKELAFLKLFKKTANKTLLTLITITKMKIYLIQKELEKAGKHDFRNILLRFFMVFKQVNIRGSMG